MKKSINYSRIILCIFFLLGISTNVLHSVNIKSISNPIQQFEHNVFDGPISNYDNRLIVKFQYGVNEYLILPNGELEKLSFFETRVNFGEAYVNEDRYYLVCNERFYENDMTTGIYVFDLTKSPMEYIDFIELETPVISNALFFSEKHIIISVVWNGKDDNGSDVSSGIYFYRLSVDDYSDVKKMVLMK